MARETGAFIQILLVIGGAAFCNPSGNPVSITKIHVELRVISAEIVIIGGETGFKMQLEAFTTVRPNIILSTADGPTGSQPIW